MLYRSPLIIAALLTACAVAPKRIETAAVQRSFEISSNQASLRAVEIFAYHGSVTLETGQEFGGEVRIDLTASNLAQAEALAEAIDLSLDEDSSGTLSLAVEPPLGASLDEMQATYVLSVPATVEVRIVTLDASVALQAFEGVASVRTESGRIRADLRNGSCELTTHGGPINLLGHYQSAVVSSQSGQVVCCSPNPGGNLTIVCGDGSATLALGPSDQIQFAFDTERGSLHSDLAVDLIEREEKGRHLFIGGRGDAELSARARITSVSAPLYIVSRISSTQSSSDRLSQSFHLALAVRDKQDPPPLR